MSVLYQNRGQKMFASLLRNKKLSASSLAAVLGTARQGVYKWINGEKLPPPEKRLAIFNIYNIPVEAWDQAPNGVVSKPVAMQPEVERTVCSVDARAEGGAEGSALDLAREQVRMALEYQREANATGALTERNKAMNQVRLAVQALSRISGEDKINDSKIVEHPRVIAVMQGIARILAPHPAVAKQVAAFLESFDSRS
jgi:transcriptional regulator with XRE-family HTH domain